MNIVIDQLDIINIFRKMYRNEKIQEKIKDFPIEMSDECKLKIHGLINKMYESWNK